MRIFRPLDARIRKALDLPPGSERLPGLRFLWLDGLFSSLSENTVAGFLELFLLSYGASNSVIGLNSSIANLFGAFAIIPGAFAVKRFGRRKDIVVWSGGGAARLALLAIAVVPFFFRGAAAASACLIGFNALRTAANNYANPAWTSMVADLVPAKARGRYFGHRNSAMIAAAIFAAPSAGYIVKLFSEPSSGGQAGYQAIFFLAFAIGCLATLSFAKIPGAEARPGEGRRNAGFSFLALLRDPRFAGLVLSAFVWNVSLQLAGPFFNVYLVKGLGASPALIGALAAVMSVSMLFGQLAFGKLTDKAGDIAVQTVTGLLIPFLPVSWLLVTDPRQVFIVNIFSGLLWAGYNLSSFNILLKLTPEEGRSDAVALYQTGVMISSVIGALLGGIVADGAGYLAAFTLSGAGRLIATLIFIIFVVRGGPLTKNAPGARALRRASRHGGKT